MEGLAVGKGKQALGVTEKLGKMARGDVSHGFRNFRDRKIRKSQKMLRVINSNLLNILGYRHSVENLKSGFKLGGAHAGNFGQRLN